MSSVFFFLACIGLVSADDMACFHVFRVVDAADHGGDPFCLRPLHVLEAAESVCHILVRLIVDRWWMGDKWLVVREVAVGTAVPNPKPWIDGRGM